MTTVVMGGGSRRKRQQARQKYALMIGAGVLVLLLLYGLYAVLHGGAMKKTVPPEVVQQITIIKPPPPPPPPPPPKDEPVKVKEEQPVPEPQQAAQPKTESPPSPQLAADSDGPGDLSGKAGGDPYIGDGPIGGGGDGPINKLTYRNTVYNELKRSLMANERIRTSNFKRVSVKVSVSSDGHIDKVELLESTGKPEIDRLIVSQLLGVGKVTSPPSDGKAKTYSWQISPEI